MCRINTGMYILVFYKQYKLKDHGEIWKKGAGKSRRSNA
jgi:hypothetical protein